MTHAQANLPLPLYVQAQGTGQRRPHRHELAANFDDYARAIRQISRSVTAGHRPLGVWLGHCSPFKIELDEWFLFPTSRVLVRHGSYYDGAVLPPWLSTAVHILSQSMATSFGLALNLDSDDERLMRHHRLGVCDPSPTVAIAHIATAYIVMAHCLWPHHVVYHSYGPYNSCLYRYNLDSAAQVWPKMHGLVRIYGNKHQAWSEFTAISI